MIHTASRELIDALFFHTSTAERICSVLSPSVKQRAKAIRCFQNMWLRLAADCREVSAPHHVSHIKTFQSRRGADGCCEWSRCNKIHVIQNVIENRLVILTFHESCGGDASRWIPVLQLKLFNPFLHFYFLKLLFDFTAIYSMFYQKTVVWQGKHLLKQYCLYILGFSCFHPWGLFFLVTLVLKHRRLLVGLLAFRTETVVQTQPLRNYYPNRICSRSQLTIDFPASAQ